ncbi:MAG: sulfotransferase family protein [Candidatus Hydrogenedentota bacterium]
MSETSIGGKKHPDFFIAGAMKSGTTALDTYLSEHPRIHMARPKDGNFFGEDFEPVRVVKDWDEYRAMFRHTKCDDISLTGEATAMYLHSKTAPVNIYHYNPRARLVVLLRNPVDLVHSFHNQLLYNGDEDVSEFERAWELQTRRARGEALPRRCRQPRQLQYYAIGALGAHMERWRHYFPWEQFKVVLFEDLVQQPHQVYTEILRFIGVETDHRVEFKPANESKQHRLRLVGHFSEQPPPWLQTVVKKAKQVTGRERFGVLDLVRALNRKPYIRPALRPAFRQYLTDVFEEDIQRLSVMVGKDLSHWTKPSEMHSPEEK